MTDNLFSNSGDIFSSDTDALPVAQAEKPSEPQRKRSIGNDKDRAAIWGEAGGSAVMDLYKSDPLIRASIDAQVAQELQDKAQVKDSNMIYDAQGNLLGVKSAGRATNTTREGAELMAAIRKDISRKYRITE